MILVRVTFLALIFCLDVHVHATATLADKKQIIDLSGEDRLVMARGSLIHRENDDTVQLVRGQFFIEVDSKSPLKFRTPFVIFRCGDSSCRILVKRSSDEVTIKNLGGSVILRRLGDSKDYLLPLAMQMSVGPVSSDGQAEMEFPQSLPWAETAKEWASLYPRDLKEFKNELTGFRDDWRSAVEAVSALHQERAGREVASAQRAASAAAARAAAIEREDAKLRKLFRQKNDLEP